MKTPRWPGAARAEELVAGTAHDPQPRRSIADLGPAVGGAVLLDGMSASKVSDTLSRFHDARFPAGRRIVLEGLRGSDFFLVVSGTAAVVVNGRPVATLNPGDFFGEMAVLDEGLRSASVVAQSPLHCLVLPNGALHDVVRDHPQVGLNLLRTLSTRLRGVGLAPA